jgi:uncharacterized membrane protein YkvA (DUF1232 family)
MSSSFFNNFKPSRMWRPGEIAADAKHAWQLLFNRRVPLALKLVLPLGALAYWFIPVDLIPLLPIDDIAILLLAMRLFVTLGDQAIVRRQGVEGAADSNGQTVDTTWHVVDESSTASN